MKINEELIQVMKCCITSKCDECPYAEKCCNKISAPEVDKMLLDYIDILVSTIEKQEEYIASLNEILEEYEKAEERERFYVTTPKPISVSFDPSSTSFTFEIASDEKEDTFLPF